jgi:hypothetical protein
MNGPVALVLLPLRAPMLVLLLLISVYLGLESPLPAVSSFGGSPLGGSLAKALPNLAALTWGAECLQAMLVVVVCTIPDLLLRQVSSLMASSRVISLVISLLLVTMGGLYMLHLEVLSVVLILGSAVLLARLDLLRIRVVPPPLLLTLVLCALVLGGLNLGRIAGPRLNPPPRSGDPPAALQQEGRRSP